MPLRTLRLGPADVATAKHLFALMARAFDEPPCDLADDYVLRLLDDGSFWALAAFEGDELAGGLTAHTLPMTRGASSELFVYDVAVREEARRRGVGRALVDALRGEAAALGIAVVFVLADDGDTHAIDFYRAIGGAPSPVTLFEFTP